MLIREVKKGDLVVFECGDYSDYTYTGPFRALADFECSEQAELWENAERAKHDLEEEDACPFWFNFRSHNYAAWLMQQGLIEDVDCVTWKGDE